MGNSLYCHCQNQCLRDYSGSMFHHFCIDTISAFSLAEIKDIGGRGNEHLISLYLATYHFGHVQPPEYRRGDTLPSAYRSAGSAGGSIRARSAFGLPSRPLVDTREDAATN